MRIKIFLNNLHLIWVCIFDKKQARQGGEENPTGAYFGRT